jgi:hypothetical protein
MPATDIDLARALDGLPDPRIDRTKKQLLGDILTVTLGAVICGADSREEVEAFGEAKHDWLRRFLALRNGHPQPRHLRPGVRPARPGGVWESRSRVDGLGVRSG